jgi:hypothetical protein
VVVHTENSNTSLLCHFFLRIPLNHQDARPEDWDSQAP